MELKINQKVYFTLNKDDGQQLINGVLAATNEAGYGFVEEKKLYTGTVSKGIPQVKKELIYHKVRLTQIFPRS